MRLEEKYENAPPEEKIHLQYDMQKYHRKIVNSRICPICGSTLNIKSWVGCPSPYTYYCSDDKCNFSTNHHDSDEKNYQFDYRKYTQKEFK